MMKLTRIAAGTPSTEATTRWPGGIRNDLAEHGRVERQHGAGDAGHAAGHHHEELAAAQEGEIGLDAERRLDHAEKDVGGGREPDRAADPDDAFERDREAAHDRRQDAPMEHKRGQHAHHQHDRQRLEGEDEVGARCLDVERQRRAAKITEHEAGAGTRRRRDGVDGIADAR